MARRIFRLVVLTLAWALLLWASAHTAVEYRVAKEVSRERYYRQRQEIFDVAVQLGRDLDHIETLLENFDRRYGDGAQENHPHGR